MSKEQTIVERFDGGIADDIRQQVSNAFGISQHFDNTTFANRLIPFRDSEADNTTQVGIMNFDWDGTKMYGLGLTLSGGLKVQMYQKTGLTGSWITPSTSVSAGILHMIGNTFKIYKGYIYHFIATNSLNRWAIGSTYTDAYQSLTFNALTDGSGLTTQGLIHTKTDTLYIGYYSSSNGSRIFSQSGSTATAVALQLPTNMIVTALAEYGSYLAIACRPVGGGNSKIFIWDMVSSDVTDVIDWGAGDLFILGNVEGRLVGVMNGASNSDITFSQSRVYIKTYAGGTPTLFKTLQDTSLVLHGPLGYKPYYNTVNGLSFGLYSAGSMVPTGIYTFSRVGANYNFEVTCEQLIFNATSVTALAGIFKVGDVVFTSYNFVADTSSNVGRTNDTASYTNTSFIESVKYNGGDVGTAKQLIGIKVNTAPNPSGGSYTVKYKMDSESSYTTIATNGVTNSLGKEHITIESTGKNLPIFKEIQFRIESTGGTEITGFKFVWEPQKTLLQLK